MELAYQVARSMVGFVIGSRFESAGCEPYTRSAALHGLWKVVPLVLQPLPMWISASGDAALPTDVCWLFSVTVPSTWIADPVTFAELLRQRFPRTRIGTAMTVLLLSCAQLFGSSE